MPSYQTTITVNGQTHKTNANLASTRQVEDNTYTGILKVTAMPNPTTAQFYLKLESSNSQDEINLVVVNGFGKVIEMKQHLSVGQIFYLGDSYIPGVYFVQVMQAGKTQQLKLVKLPD